MGTKPVFNDNEKLAPKLAKKVLKPISGLLLLLGKPMFLFLLFALTVLIHAANITAYLVKKFLSLKTKVNYLIISFGIRKKSGVIFSASHEHFKSKLKILSKKLRSLSTSVNNRLEIYTKWVRQFLWHSDVLLLALEKLLTRLFIYTKTKIQPVKTFRIQKLKFSLFFVTLKKHFHKIRLPKPARASFLKIMATLFSLIFLMGFIGGVGFWYFILKDLPDPHSLTSRKQQVSTKIYDRNGNLLYNIYKDQNRTPVSLDEIPVQVKSATIAIEDAEFYSHPGFSVKGIVRAIVKNYKEDRLTGGSTITQQLVKNTLLTPEKTYIRKLKEIVLAIKVELTFPKDKILEMYLNEVSYGGTAYGIQEASRTYFGKDAKYLSLAEAALLAGLPKSPTEFSPFGTNPNLAKNRQKEVLRLMKVNGFITEEQKRAAEQEEITFIDQKTDIKAAHFVMYVREILEEKYGKSVIDTGGLEITTSLDYSIQTLAEKTVIEELEKLAKLNVTNAAVVVLNPKTGEVLAMVGSRNYFDTEGDGNVNVTIRPRQPGSSIKVVNYAYALSNGMNATTIIKDYPVTFLVEGQPPYSPKNYEGNYRGNVTLRSALAESRNIPAVRVLASYGVDKMINHGKKMGITTWQDTKNYGLSLTLGGGEVKLLELAQVYATIANYGLQSKITPVIKIADGKGNIIDEFRCGSPNSIMIAQAQASESAYSIKNTTNETNCNGEQILDPRVAFLITDILKDNKARTPTFGSNSLLTVANHPEVAVKTGTSNNLRDNLAIGYNQDYLVAVWVGNNDNSPMDRIASGVTGATPIWNKIISALLANEESREWQVPEKLVDVTICPYTGTLGCQGCANKKEWFLEENVPEKKCNPDWFIAKDDENNLIQTTDYNQDDQEPAEEVKNNFKPEIIDIDKSKNLKVNLFGRN